MTVYLVLLIEALRCSFEIEAVQNSESEHGLGVSFVFILGKEIFNYKICKHRGNKSY